MSKYDLKIYVACLASYNNGRLHGAWIDVEGKDADDIMDEVRERVLLTSPYPNVEVECPKCEGEGCDACCNGMVASAEEWAIHDHEGFGNLLEEYTSFDRVAEHAEMIEEYGEAWIAYCEHVGEHYATEDGFQDSYAGEWNSEREYAEDFFDNHYAHEMPEHLAAYFDYERFARDLFMNDMSFVDGYVFHNC